MIFLFLLLIFIIDILYQCVKFNYKKYQFFYNKLFNIKKYYISTI